MPTYGHRMTCIRMAFAFTVWLASPALADEVSEIVYDDAPGWQVARGSDRDGALLNCELGIGGAEGVVYLKQATASKAMTLFPIGATSAVTQVILADRFTATVIVDGREVLTTPPDSTFATLAKATDRDALLLAIADGSQMTVRFVAGAATADMTFSLIGSATAVAAYRDCLSGQDGSSSGNAAVTTTESRDFPAPLGWSVWGTKFSDSAETRYSTCSAAVRPEGAPFHVAVMGLAGGSRILSAWSNNVPGPWLEPVLTLASSVSLPLVPKGDGTGGELVFLEGQDAAFEAVLVDLAKDGTLTLSDAASGQRLEMRVGGATMGVASLRDCLNFIAG